MFNFWNNLNPYTKVVVVIIIIAIIVVIIGIILYVIFHKPNTSENFEESNKYVGNNVIWSFCQSWRNSIIGSINKKN